MYRFIIELLKITKNVYYHIDFQLSLMALNLPYGLPSDFSMSALDAYHICEWFANCRGEQNST